VDELLSLEELIEDDGKKGLSEELGDDVPRDVAWLRLQTDEEEAAAL